MKAIAITLFTLLCGISVAAAHGWDSGYGSPYGYYGDNAGYWRSYERGYHGEPRFFRSWHDSMAYPQWDGYDAPIGGYLPPATGLYSEDRGYGVEGRGWQLP
ncbi:MAG TPA: hypothetical protein VG798_01660 [Rhizomicrobium sp.]|nr:hypothetical protein [Rhizomicrobium sp.]